MYLLLEVLMEARLNYFGVLAFEEKQTKAASCSQTFKKVINCSKMTFLKDIRTECLYILLTIWNKIF